MPKVKLEVRQSQVIYQAAVGSIVYIGRHSLVPCDTRYWKDDGEEVDMPRLSHALEGRSFRKAPVQEQRGPVVIGGRVPVVRFPGWMYCPKCRKMYGDPRSDGPAEDLILCPSETCLKAKSVLASMPWMMICRNGHMDDLPWHILVHRESKNPTQKTCRDYSQLLFRPADARHRRPRVECGACGAHLPLQGLRAKTFLTGVTCRGKQPWLRDEEECDARAESASLIAVGLGDGFAYHPVVTSALDIPPESRLDPRDDTGRHLREHPDWRLLQELHEKHGPGRPAVIQRVGAIALSIGMSPESVWVNLSPAREKKQEAEEVESPLAQSHLLRADEYKAFLKEIKDYREYERFITISKTDAWNVGIASGELQPRARQIATKITKLVGAPRLREVRAFQGFTRIAPFGSDDVRMVPADVEGKSTWLPVAEFFGEGLFFVMDREILGRWGGIPAVVERTRVVRKRYEAWQGAKQIGISEEALPQFIAIHTLAHLLIRQMAFECGYPAASLRERLYVSEGDAAMTGVLVYLAAGEPGGSLGGLAELAEPDRFLKLLLRSIEAAQWCALDPVCGEHEGRGEPPLNRAACHACCLLPETSCECGNLLLDRTLIASPTGAEMTGFFDTE